MSLPHTQHRVVVDPRPASAPSSSLVPLSEHERRLSHALTQRQAALLAAFRARLARALQQSNAATARAGLAARQHLSSTLRSFEARLRAVAGWLGELEAKHNAVKGLRGDNTMLRRVLLSERAGAEQALAGLPLAADTRLLQSDTAELDERGVRELLEVINDRIQHRDVASAGIVKELVRLDAETEHNMRRLAEEEARWGVRAGAGEDKGKRGTGVEEPKSGLKASTAPVASSDNDPESDSTPAPAPAPAPQPLSLARATLAALYSAALTEAEEDDAARQALATSIAGMEAHVRAQREQVRAHAAEARKQGVALGNSESARAEAAEKLTVASEKATAGAEAVLAAAVAHSRAAATHCERVSAQQATASLNRVGRVGTLCEGCLKQLINAHVMWPCGHVLCKACVDRGIERRPGTTVVESPPEYFPAHWRLPQQFRELRWPFADGVTLRIACIECRADLHAAIAAVDEGVDSDGEQDDVDTPVMASLEGNKGEGEDGEEREDPEAERRRARERALQVLKKVAEYRNPYLNPQPGFAGSHLPLPLPQLSQAAGAVCKVEMRLDALAAEHATAGAELREMADRLPAAVAEVMATAVRERINKQQEQEQENREKTKEKPRKPLVVPPVLMPVSVPSSGPPASMREALLSNPFLDAYLRNKPKPAASTEAAGPAAAAVAAPASMSVVPDEASLAALEKDLADALTAADALVKRTAAAPTAAASVPNRSVAPVPAWVSPATASGPAVTAHVPAEATAQADARLQRLRAQSLRLREELVPQKITNPAYAPKAAQPAVETANAESQPTPEDAMDSAGAASVVEDGIGESLGGDDAGEVMKREAGKAEAQWERRLRWEGDE